jgi:hypothetical protein
MSGIVGLDIRAPIGGLFAVLGLILAGYGLAAPASSTVIGINVDLWWGLVMLVFGVTLLLFARRAMKRMV